MTRQDNFTEFGIYSSRMNRTLGETEIVSGKQKGSRTELSGVVGWLVGGQAMLSPLCADPQHGQDPPI